MNKILLVDDDYELTSSLKRKLETENFDVLLAHDGENALVYFDSSIKLLLLDIIIPRKNGIDVLKEIRKKYRTPIIMLTTLDSQIDRLLTLELGADDYLSKPFDERELIARIKAVLRRSNWTEQEIKKKNAYFIKVDFLRLDSRKQEATFAGIPLELTGTEFILLHLLAKNSGKVLSRAYLSEKALGRCLTPFDRAIDMHISNLRKKLPNRKDGNPWFKTLRGKGYFMVSTQ